MRAAESAEGIEEERRLFYVALTRAKCAATISYAEMRFKWGNMEFSRPSCFLREMDPAYIESEVDFRAERQRPAPSEEGVQAIDELRRRFDYRFQQKRQEGASAGSYGQRTGYGSAYPSRPLDGESGRVQRFTRQNDPYRKQGSTSYPNTRTQFDGQVKSAIDTLKGEPRRLVRTASAPTPSATPSSCAFHAGDRVEHPTFGRGEIMRIEQANGDWKLVVEFPNVGQKTLLAKFAKLRKL